MSWMDKRECDGWIGECHGWIRECHGWIRECHASRWIRENVMDG